MFSKKEGKDAEKENPAEKSKGDVPPGAEDVPKAQKSTTTRLTTTSKGTATEGGDRDNGFGRRQSTVSANSTDGPGVLDFAGNYDPGEDEKELRNESSSVIRFYPTWCRCFRCLRRDHPFVQHGSSWRDTLCEAFLCPPQGPCARVITFILTISITWIFLWLILFEVEHDPLRSPASPKGPIFALLVIELVGLFCAILAKTLYLPSLLGPLILGIILNNVKQLNIYNFFVYFDFRKCHSGNTYCMEQAIKTSGHWITPIRKVALTMILTRAGLELSPKQLLKLKGVVPLLAFAPCLAEACVCAGFLRLMFEDRDLSIAMCFTAGFALAAVSPAVVVPGMLSIKRKNLGVAQGVPTLLIAASSIDDVLAISLYTICMGLSLGSSKEGWKIYAGGPIGIGVGIVHGIIVGSFLHFIPARDNKNKAKLRLALILLLNFVALFGYEEVELVAGAGSLAVLVTSFIASFGWRSQPHWKQPMKNIEKSLSVLWTLCVPILFGTIGREINFQADGFTYDRVGKIIAVIFISLTCRCLTAYLVCYAAPLMNWKERLFCALAWVPKATVQATLAPLVVSKIQELTDPVKQEELKLQGQIIVTLAVLAVLITAPLGAVLIATTSKYLLRAATIPERVDLDDEFPNGDGEDTEVAVVVAAYRGDDDKDDPSLVQLPSNSTEDPMASTMSVQQAKKN